MIMPTGIKPCDNGTILGAEMLVYEGKRYLIGTGHKGFIADKEQAKFSPLRDEADMLWKIKWQVRKILEAEAKGLTVKRKCRLRDEERLSI